MCGYSHLNTLGLVACEAAYRSGVEWLDQCRAYPRGSLDFMRTFLAQRIPQIKLVEHDGTYFAWLDCAGLGMNCRELEKELGFGLFYRSGKGMAPTDDGIEYVSHVRQVYEDLLQKYGKLGKTKKKFGISTQHYSFAVKRFVETVKNFSTAEYDFAIRETTTRDVIADVSMLKSEIGIIYMSEFNRKVLTKLLKSNGLEFHRLIECTAYVYLWKGHPLAGKPSIAFEKLADYPCLSFEQGDSTSFYYAEEILSTNEYTHTIKATERATMLNLMIGLKLYPVFWHRL